MNTNYNVTLLQQALSAHQQGNLALARKLYQAVLTKEPANFDCLHMLGVICLTENQLGEAQQYLEQAIAIHQSDAGAFNNLGLVMQAQGKFREALAYFETALSLNTRYAEAFSNKALTLQELGELDKAIAALEQAIVLMPEHAYFHNNLGLAYFGLGQLPSALNCLNTALKLSARYPNALYNRGNVFAALGSYQSAVRDYDAALTLEPKNAAVHFNRANSLMYLGKFSAADNSYQRAIDLDDKLPYLLGARLHNRMHYCNWSNFNAECNKLVAAIEAQQQVIAPFALLSLSDDSDIHFKAAKIWHDDKCRSYSKILPFKSKATHGNRIKIAYFSADFHNHATAQLIAGVLERHDRTRFEIIAYSFGPNLNDSSRQRITNAVEHFYEVSGLTDEHLIEHARSQGIEIAIDLKGYTQQSRPQIFAHRVAPIQMNYLGYPGTLAMESMDYILIDSTIRGAGDHELKLGPGTENILTLPDCYQANDTITDELPSTLFSRSDLGLPAQGFVFCCFNSAHKILPDVFQTWMGILKRVPASVIWLLGDEPNLQKNLRREAKQLGISAERLIFAPKMDLNKHLARLVHADLFLDTFPYTAHTTASDALRAGVPVITRIGNSFPSRVAASLLATLELQELITANPTTYAELAIALATDPIRLNKIKSRLAPQKLSTTLFNPAKFASDLEAVFTQLIGPKPGASSN